MFKQYFLTVTTHSVILFLILLFLLYQDKLKTNNLRNK